MEPPTISWCAILVKQRSFSLVDPIVSFFLIGNARVHLSDLVCNLGVNPNSHHINDTASNSIYLQIEDVSLNNDHLKTMVIFFHSIALGLNASLYYDLSKQEIDRLHVVAYQKKE